MTERILTITKMGSSGDGVCDVDGARLHVPFTLPGDVAAVDGPDTALRVKRLVTASPDRTTPACRHYGSCGGCVLQDWAEAPYLDFKRDLVASALASKGLDPALVAPCRSQPARTRRRATFAAARRGKTVVLGFHKRKSHDIIDLAECAVIAPQIRAALPALRQVADEVLTGAGQATLLVTLCDNGLDLHIASTPKGFSERDSMRVTAAALEAGFIRVGIHNFDTLARETPRISVGTADMLSPVGGFLQATPEGEANLAALVADHVAGARKVADLFAGAGTFALRLARTATVHAVENHAPAIDALAAASRAAASRLTPITCETRDLYRRPLLKHELNGFDAVVLDPPRAGAAAQVEELAKASVGKVAYVSCNPGTLARDLRVLVDGGYTLTRVTPVDQFLWSAHVEAVAELVK